MTAPQPFGPVLHRQPRPTEADRRRCQNSDDAVRGDCDAGLWKPSVFLGIATLVFGVAFFVGTM